jgi:hypothetical protein
MTQPRPADLDPRSRRQRRQSADLARAEARERRWAQQRFAVPYDTDGPRLTMGVLWFAAAIAATVAGPYPLAVLTGVVAVVASLQGVLAWRSTVGVWRPAAVLLAAAPPAAAAAAGISGLGAAVAVGALLAAASVLILEGRADAMTLTQAEILIRCGLAPGLAAGSLVALAGIEVGLVIALVVLVSAYETGDFIVGSGSSNAVEGPLAGILSVLVVGSAVILVRPPGLDELGDALLAIGLVVVLAPAGQVFASALLPRGAAWAPALRRLDSYLLVAPAWILVL